MKTPQKQHQAPRRQHVSSPKPPPPRPENVNVHPPSPLDSLFPLFEDMKLRLLSVELLWTRVKQLELRVENMESNQLRMNGRISVAMRRQYVTDEEAPESQDVDVGVPQLEEAEEIAKRLHSDQNHSVQPQAPQTTTSQTSRAQSRENSVVF